MEQQFILEMNELIKEKINEIAPIVDAYQIFKLNINLSSDKLNNIFIKYFNKHHKDFGAILEINYLTNGFFIDFYYKNKIVRSQGHEVLPENYKEVSILRVLQECINQYTNTPDIKYLEIGDK